MNETIEQQQRRVAGYMRAIARLLAGADVRHETFLDRVQLLVGGSAANLPTLLHWGDHVRRTGVPILLFSPGAEPRVPQVTLVSHIDGHTHTVENCMLWMAPGDNRAHLVPDGFNYGAFILDADLRFRRVGRAPARDFKRATPGMVRAYDRLLELEIEQRRSGSELPLPSLLRKAA